MQSYRPDLMVMEIALLRPQNAPTILPGRFY